ncbi:hypothetical protein C8F01DRAFT_1368726 [Mycena amicta]|nr:hypothetical protein C8F01DRAFT_1368726 [Mycena amicta]
MPLEQARDAFPQTGHDEAMNMPVACDEASHVTLILTLDHHLPATALLSHSTIALPSLCSFSVFKALSICSTPLETAPGKNVILKPSQASKNASDDVDADGKIFSVQAGHAPTIAHQMAMRRSTEADKREPRKQPRRRLGEPVAERFYREEAESASELADAEVDEAGFGVSSGLGSKDKYGKTYEDVGRSDLFNERLPSHTRALTLDTAADEDVERLADRMVRPAGLKRHGTE